MDMEIAIIGAGICGLTTAIALEKKGFKPKIYEQSSILKPVGAGIIMASNAMQVFRHLGLNNRLEVEGMPLNAMNITNDTLQKISRIDLNYFKRKYNLQSLVIHRGKLQQVLLENLKHTEINLDFRLNSIENEEKGCRLVFENGRSVFPQLVLGADGIRSRVRESLYPESKIRTMNQVCWRGVTSMELPSIYRNELTEAWGKGSRFAFVQFSKDKIYWYAVKSFAHSEMELSEDQLNSYFRKYPSIVQEILASTPHRALHRTVMEDLQPIETWYDEYTCLIGDAAHATTPNMGQGACQSIEDAYVIAESLAKYQDRRAFKEYQELRRPLAHKVVNQSRQIGRISHWTNPIGVAFRNTVMKLIPERQNRIQLEKLFQLEKAIS